MEKLIRLIPLFAKQRIIVLGDIMIDQFVWGKVSRISPEAPVPVVEVTRENQTFGGAGNVANNIKSLGGQVQLLGVIGNDYEGGRLTEEFRSRGIGVDGLVNDHTRPTITKTRIIASHQQVVRVDREIKGKFAPDVEKKIISRLESMMPSVDAIIISDYGKGVISRTVLSRAIALARGRGIPVTVDPKIEHFLNYKKVTCITPNTKEAIEGMRSPEITDEAGMAALGKKILKKLGSDSVLITRGEKGMSLFEPGDRITSIPTRAKEVFDVTGAGDTVISTLTLALAAGAKLREAAEIANFAAGLVVAKLGTATVSPEELRQTIMEFGHKK